MTIACPSCTAELNVPDDADVGEVIVCTGCDADLEVVSTGPLVIEPFEEEEK